MTTTGLHDPDGAGAVGCAAHGTSRGRSGTASANPRSTAIPESELVGRPHPADTGRHEVLRPILSDREDLRAPGRAVDTDHPPQPPGRLPDVVGELRAGAPAISKALLAQRLELLERHGVILKQRQPDGHRVSYELTEKGRELKAVTDAMGTWGRAGSRSNRITSIRQKSLASSVASADAQTRPRSTRQPPKLGRQRRSRADGAPAVAATRPRSCSSDGESQRREHG